jgi:hypothetical protein
MLAIPAQLGLLTDWIPVVLMTAGLAVLSWTIARHRLRRVGAVSRPVEAPPGREVLRAVMGDAEELAHRLATELDAKAERLERLIAQADDRLRRLDAPVSASEAKPPRRAPSVVGGEDGRDPLNRRVYTLADEGLPPVAIAQRLDQPTGKVELILALRGR